MNRIITLIVQGTEYNHTYKWNSFEEFKQDINTNVNLQDKSRIVLEAYIDDNLIDMNNTLEITLNKLLLIVGD